MAKAIVNFDKTELVVQIADKMSMSMNINQSDITTILIEPTEEKGGFLGMSKKPSEEIIIKTKKGPPCSITKSAVMNAKENWDNYKKWIERFADDNKLTFQNNCK